MVPSLAFQSSFQNQSKQNPAVSLPRVAEHGRGEILGNHSENEFTGRTGDHNPFGGKMPGSGRGCGAERGFLAWRKHFSNWCGIREYLAHLVKPVEQGEFPGMDERLSAVELTGVIDERRHLKLDYPLPIDGPRRVRVIVLYLSIERRQEHGMPHLQASLQNRRLPARVYHPSIIPANGQARRQAHPQGARIDPLDLGGLGAAY
jgi:hypothetical protein